MAAWLSEGNITVLSAGLVFHLTIEFASGVVVDANSGSPIFKLVLDSVTPAFVWLPVYPVLLLFLTHDGYPGRKRKTNNNGRFHIFHNCIISVFNGMSLSYFHMHPY